MNSVKETNNALGVLLLGGVILTITAVSGFGQSLHINEVMAISFALVASVYTSLPYSKTPPLGKWLRLFVPIACCAIAISVILSEFKTYKIINFTSLFGLLIGTGIISEF